MPNLRLRDRDAIVTREGLVLRVFGYSHPPDAFVCDAEYAPAELFRSNNPKAPRNEGKQVFYKFYDDEGWKLIQSSFPQYLIFHRMLRRKTIGVGIKDVCKTRKPDEKLRELMTAVSKDELVEALQNALALTFECSTLSASDFGVFGSLLHDFYNPRLSDIDFTIYGRDKVALLRETLQELYADNSSPLSNEFETGAALEGKRWRFRNFGVKEFIWHQRRKLTYALFQDKKSKRVVKTEFEPVKDWREIKNDYNPEATILRRGWVRLLANVTDDSDAPFIPSTYGIEPVKVLTGAEIAEKTVRVVSFLEEFRLQAFKGETIYIEGNLEEVRAPDESFYQIVLTYCPRYYEQVLKAVPKT